MSVTGVVLGVSPDWRGSTLTVATAATDTVLSFVDAVDFDEDGGWLVMADQTTPRQYLSANMDADTVTLAAAVGEVFEADLPVSIWDPTVGTSGSPVVEYIAQVDLDDESGPVDATVPHGIVPEAGADHLVGASVTIEEAPDDDSETPEWVVASVDGREARVDPDYVATPFFRAYLGSNKTIPHDTTTILDGWIATDNTGFENPSPGRRTIYREGLYSVATGTRWGTSAGTGGRKSCNPVVLRVNGTVEPLWADGRPNSGTGEESAAADVPIRLYPGDQVYITAWQNSGAGLAVLGASGSRLDMSFFSILYEGA